MLNRPIFLYMIVGFLTHKHKFKNQYLTNTQSLSLSLPLSNYQNNIYKKNQNHNTLLKTLTLVTLQFTHAVKR